MIETEFNPNYSKLEFIQIKNSFQINPNLDSLGFKTLLGLIRIEDSDVIGLSQIDFQQ